MNQKAIFDNNVDVNNNVNDNNNVSDNATHNEHILVASKYSSRFQLQTILNPNDPLWSSVPSKTAALMGAPLALQPTSAIQVDWENKTIGVTREIDISAILDSEQLAIRLQWACEQPATAINDTDQFVDAAAVMIAVDPKAVLFTMGSAQAPVNMLYWRADEDDGYARHVVATGIGTTKTLNRVDVRVNAQWKHGLWKVVMMRALSLNSPEPVAQLSSSRTAKIAVAVWNGSQQERAGIKSLTPAWIPLHFSS